MTINDSTLSTDVWNDVRSKLVAASLETTNSSDSSTSSASINATYNDKSGTKPQVIINPIIMDEADYKFSGTYGRRVINVVIDIYDKTTEYVDQLSDQVKAALAPNDVSGIDLVGVAEDYAFSSPGANKYHLKSLTFSYQRE